MDLVIESLGDRWEDHRAVHQLVGNNSNGERQHLWQYNLDQTEITIRKTDADITVPDQGVRVTFSLDCVPVQKRGGKRIAVNDPVEWLTKKLGDGIVVEKIVHAQINGSVYRKKSHNSKFTRPAYSFIGHGVVSDSKVLEELLRNGIGDAKTYGFGMLEVGIV